MTTPLLTVENLTLNYRTGGDPVQALRGVSLTARAGEVLGIVGESGCGKSTLAATLMGLAGTNAEITDGAVSFRGENILTAREETRRKLRGKHIAMVFQDPMTAFNPVLTIGAQLVDFQHNSGTPKRQRHSAARDMLDRVGIPDPDICMGRFPHELSGGMRQRAAIAAALLMQPEILIADEPTTALDVTMEAQIIHLLRNLQSDYDGAIIIVTHQLGVIAQLCDRVVVMYAGQVVEEADVDTLFHAPRHPYTKALIACDPASLSIKEKRLPTIGGRPPDLAHPPAGCAFADRCAQVEPICRTAAPPRVEIGPDHIAKCHEAWS
ncbi:ABC transporter ATP-binding protein [Rhodospirillaceae bacterium KN72]|uniref:ABC transporter ATP-binding protein n=1 Tax=Pacificispira spongiicola TaxID=2729598 RepID=A0A7Y0DXC8_9PROT|nr:ABC transporter ATP-binding protein [Pacificispira spongiicola]NMM43348.1 ABC transporter ATP-binding protein [Pacificispira spongiicola]